MLWPGNWMASAPEDQAEAARFIADVAAVRKPGELNIRMKSMFVSLDIRRHLL